MARILMNSATVQDELDEFYKRSGFGDVPGARPRTVRVYTGCLLVPMPNIEARRRFLKYHDLHHLVTGFSIGRIGEGQVSAWELGSGSAFVSPMLGVMNLIALSTGLVLDRKRMWRAFLLGCNSRNLYPAVMRTQVDAGRWPDVAALRTTLLDSRKSAIPLALRAVEFSTYAIFAMFIHAAIAIPALIIRFVTDIMLGQSFIEAIKPKKRADLY
jgi:hypothetical protein